MVPGGSRRIAAQFQGIPSWVLLVLPITQKAAREVLEAWYFTRHGRRMVLEPGISPGRCRSGPRGLVLHQGSVGVVLEAWYYPGRCRSDPRGLVFHQGGVGVVLEAWYYTRAVWEWS